MSKKKVLKIPNFFKTKRFIIVAVILALVLVVIQAGLFQADKKIENILHKQAQNGIQQFEKQTGLQIQWQKLNFNILKMTVYLEGVEVRQGLSRKEEFSFLDGLQKIKKISARPSLFFLLFKKEIFLSKVNIEQGEVFLSYLKPLKKIPNQSQKNIRFPIKKFQIKNSNIVFQYKDHTLNFLRLNTSIKQKKAQAFYFRFSVPSFFIKNAIQSEQQEPSQTVEKSQSYQISTRGVFKPNDLSLSSLSVKNAFFKSLSPFLKIRFDNNRLSFLEMSSSGSLPLALIQQLAELSGQSIRFSESYLNYDLSLSYDKKKKWQGDYDLSAENIFFKTVELKKIKAKGVVKGGILSMDRGELTSQKEGSFVVKKLKWHFLQKQQPYQFNIQSSMLSTKLISQHVLDVPQFPVSADLTGAISCEGFYKAPSIACHFKGISQKVTVQLADQEELFSVYGFDWDMNLTLGNQAVNFNLKGEKEKASLKLEGEYSFLLEELSAGYFFEGDVQKDLRFPLPFELKGWVLAKEGTVLIKEGDVDVSGHLLFSQLYWNQYFLDRLSCFYRFSGSKLVFFDGKGQLGASSYLAKAVVDFDKESVNIEGNSQFFSLEDFAKAIKAKSPLPFELKGTGQLFVAINYPWAQPESQDFVIKGSFFNIFINNDFFKQSEFEWVLKDQKGLIDFFLQKEKQALLKAKGSFNSKYQCDVALSITNIPLESVQFFNTLFPFNQVGDINGELKMAGYLNDPQITGQLVVSNTFLYSYSVKDTALRLSIDKKALTFSGRIMDEIQIEEFSYSFLKKPKTKIKASFENLDIVTFLLSKDRKDKIQNYQSKIKGSIDLQKESTWKGFVNIKDFSITKSHKNLKSLSPFFLNLDKKIWSLSPVDFIDNNNQLFQIKADQANKLTLSGVLSLDFLSVLFPFFKEMEGRLEGSLFVNNNLRQLKPSGSLQLKQALFVVPEFPDFANVSARLDFFNDKFFIKDFKGLAGGGQLKGFGTLEYDFVKPPILDLNMDFEKVFLQFPEGFNTTGKGNIKITGSKIPYLISGQYDIQGGSIVREFSSSAQSMDYDFTFIEEENKKQDSIFNIQLNLKTKKAISVTNSLIQLAIEGSAYVYGPLNATLMRGRFQLSQSGQKNLIFFRGQEFAVDSGSIVFNNSSPKNPYLDFSAGTVFKERVIDPLVSDNEIEKQYDILLFVKGPADDTSFSLRSNPVLNEKEILSLLTLRVNSQHFDSNVNEDFTGYSYQLLTSLLIEKPLNREIKEALGLDFRLTPYINTSNKPVTKLTLSRTWFEKWKTSFSRTLDLEEEAQSDLRLKYDISSNMSLTAFWENRGEVKLEESANWLGFDLEFNFDF